jgi:flagellar motor protein MotB
MKAMGLKSIEMQVALPRTQDAGKMQEQMQRQGEQLQGTLAQAQQEKEKSARTQVKETEAAEELKLKKEAEEKQQEDAEEKEEKHNAHQEETEHPYLGKRIDLNG